MCSNSIARIEHKRIFFFHDQLQSSYQQLWILGVGRIGGLGLALLSRLFLNSLAEATSSLTLQATGTTEECHLAWILKFQF